MKPTLSTSRYEWSHGKKPRGYGYWAFFFDKGNDAFWHTGKFAEAKQRAVAWAVTKGHSVIEVGA